MGFLPQKLEAMPFRSVKGTTGTQASFLELFDGEAEKVEKLERIVADKMGFEKVIAVKSFDSMKSAVAEAVRESRQGDIVILSPMCASFDEFANYKERGKAFVAEIKRLVG
jgi:adenylosuccinate lyase